jgi:hypothetical protein
MTPAKDTVDPSIQRGLNARRRTREIGVEWGAYGMSDDEPFASIRGHVVGRAPIARRLVGAAANRVAERQLRNARRILSNELDDVVGRDREQLAPR